MVDLVAREDQLLQLHTLLDQAMRGGIQIICVTGEAGIGKTALVTTFLDEVRRRTPNIFIATTKCYAIAGSQQEAFLPFWQILEAIISEKPGDATWDLLRRAMADIAPDWLAAIPGVGGVIAATVRTYQWGRREFGAQERGVDTGRRMVQYTNALRLAAQTLPLLLWIDDLHWSDSATLDLISFLADHASNSPILLVIAYRPTDIADEAQSQTHPVKRLVSKLERYHQAVELELPSFREADLAWFLAVRGYRFTNTFVNRLWRHSGGNPLFVQEYIALLQARGLLKQESGRFMLAQPDVDVMIPNTVRAVIEQRLDLIGRDLRRLLSYASVQGERFASRVLAHLLAAPELDILDKLNSLDRVHNLIRELEAQHLIVKVGAEYQFIHVLIQHVVYNDLSGGQRRRLHEAIAQLLESFYGEDAPRYASDLAVHFERAGMPAQASDYYIQASHNALAALAFDDAIVQAEAVRRMARAENKDQHVVKWYIEGLICIAEAQLWKAEHAAVLATCDEGEVLCQQEGNMEHFAQFLYWRAQAFFGLGRRVDYLAALRQALQILGPTPLNRSLQGHLYALLGDQYGTESSLDMERALDMALRIGREYQLAEVQVDALEGKGWLAIALRDRPDDALQFGLEGLEIAQNRNMATAQIDLHRLIGCACRYLKLAEEASFHNNRAVEIARRSGAPYKLHEALASLAILWRQVKENPVQALKIAQEAIAVAKQYEFRPDYWVIGECFDAAFGLGRWEEAWEALNNYFDLYQSFYPRWFHRQRGYIAYAHGRYREAIGFYEQSLAPFDVHGPDERDIRIVQPWLGLALLEVGEVDRSVEQLEMAYSYWKGRDPARFAQSLRGLARVDLVQGAPQSAVLRLRQALGNVEGYYNEDAWPAWPHVCTDLGWALLTTGDAEEALQHALVGYRKFRKMQHLLLGEAAFVVGQILLGTDKPDEAVAYLREAHSEWDRLELRHFLPTWTAVMQEHGLLE